MAFPFPPCPVPLQLGVGNGPVSGGNPPPPRGQCDQGVRDPRARDKPPRSVVEARRPPATTEMAIPETVIEEDVGLYAGNEIDIGARYEDHIGRSGNFVRRGRGCDSLAGRRIGGDPCPVRRDPLAIDPLTGDVHPLPGRALLGRWRGRRPGIDGRGRRLLLSEPLLRLALVDSIARNGADERAACGADQRSGCVVAYRLAGYGPADCADSRAFLRVVSLVCGAGIGKKRGKNSKSKYRGFHNASFDHWVLCKGGARLG